MLRKLLDKLFGKKPGPAPCKYLYVYDPFTMRGNCWFIDNSVPDGFFRSPYRNVFKMNKYLKEKIEDDGFDRWCVRFGHTANFSNFHRTNEDTLMKAIEFLERRLPLGEVE